MERGRVGRRSRERRVVDTGGPPCGEAQADGVPCDELGRDCEDCDKVEGGGETRDEPAVASDR